MNTTTQNGLRPAASARLPHARGFGWLAGKRLLAPALVAGLALGGIAAAGAHSAAATEREAAQRDARAAAIASKAREEAGRKVHELIARHEVISDVRQSAFDGEEQVTASDTPARLADAATITGLAAQVPSLAGLEAAQIEQVALLTAQAESRGDTAERTIRRAGLSPRLIAVRAGGPAGEGGPLQRLAGGSSADPALNRLAAAVTRMSALERGLDRIPTHAPANVPFVSSSFGYRSDPFTGEAAMHAGLDFPAPSGTPIHAAAAGVVTFVGSKGGYGNCVEVTHGNGMMTRYGHMAGFKARVGQKVAAGETIGLIGSTGRSTGPHLHFEVRVNGAAVNPKPFLDAAA